MVWQAGRTCATNVLWSPWLVCAAVFLMIGMRAEKPSQLRVRLEKMLALPRVRAFLDTIAFAEGTYAAGRKGYHMLYTGEYVRSLKDHPARAICSRLHGERLCSTAAGRYMFLERTWQKVAEHLGLQTFEPHAQDIGALYLIYQKGALEDVTGHNIVGNLEHEQAAFVRAIFRVSRVWASFPGAPYGQPTKNMNLLYKQYRTCFKKRRRGIAMHRQGVSR